MEQEITIAPGEATPPGFPTGHGPGRYLVDYEARTIRPVPIEAVEVSQPEHETLTESQPIEEPIIENQGG